jgi:glycosyltransferase involved in cell wall biosynthesis
LVSIVTPSFNQAPFLEETILSVLNQDYPRIEYIVIDGGSADGSVDLIRKYEDRLAYWVSEPDKGQADAINKGFNRAHGELLGWLNSDDTYTSGSIRRSVERLMACPRAVAVHGRANVVDQNSRVVVEGKAGEPKTFNLREELCGNVICQPTVLMRRGPLFEVGLLDPNLHYALDFDLWPKLALKGEIVEVGTVQANFRISDTSKSMALTDRFLPEVLSVLDLFFARTDLPNEIRSLRRLAISNYYAHEAPHPLYRPRHLMTQEQIQHMRRSLWTSIRWYPHKLRTIVSLAEIWDSYLQTNSAEFMRRLWRRLLPNR